MRASTAHCLFLLTSALLTVSAAPHVFAADDAARALAERFAGASAPAAADNSQLNAETQTEEAEILARARAEDQLRAEEIARQDDARRATELKDKAQAEKAAQKIEHERQAVAKAETERAAAAERQAQTDAEAAADAARVATSAQAEATAQDQRAREAEVNDLAEKLKRVREARPVVAPPGAMGLGMPPPAAEPETLDQALVAPQERRPDLPAAFVRNATSVTVLLTMEPGTNGIRRGSKTADPVLCLDSWCYVSNGPATPAKVMSRAAALGPLNTLGLRAGACRQSLTCIYRGLDIAAYFKTGAKPANMQPVDLRYLHHDRRDSMPLTVATNCAASPNKLTCAVAIKGKGWTAWIVPEELAVSAGVEALQAALANGLATTPTRAASLKFSR